MSALGHWSAQQLAEFLAVVSSYPDQRSAMEGAVERAAEAVEAEVAALLVGREVLASVGFPRGHAPVNELREAALGLRPLLDVPGVGPCEVIVIPLDGHRDRSLVVARSGEPFGLEETSLLRGMGRVLSLAVGMLALIEDERAQVDENARLLASLQERQTLFERLFKIQRSISHRAPIQEVLDSITEGAADLLGDEVVGLRLLEEADRSTMCMVSAVGIPTEDLGRLRHGPVGEGVGGRAISENRLVIASDYPGSNKPLAYFVDAGLAAAMAAPVHRNGEVVGSLTVASRRTGRRYSPMEQEVLLAFAEHVSLALNDASAVDAMRRSFDTAVHQATHDPLTGLPNRTLVIDRLSHALGRCRRRGTWVGVLFVDLDRFKVVNDSLGHAVGDEVLMEVARRLGAAVRRGDTVGRLAGDEFVVVCEDLRGEADLLRVADSVARAVSAPMPLYGRDAVITPSIGVALYNDHDREQGAEDLLRDADVAMYRAKERGRARIEMFDQAMRTRMLERLETEHALRRAVWRDELELHYQPTFRLSDRSIVSLEALVRWRHPERGLVAPDDFIPLAEETGLIVPIGAWVLNEACRQMAEWRAADPSLAGAQVAVNLSARQFSAPDLPALVAHTLEETGLPPGCLSLEITESVLMEEAGFTVDALAALHNLGVGLSIDDFGTGYSSLSYLKRFPVDTLKIDRSFVDGLGEDPEDEAIVGAVISLARALSLGVIAEGVETEVQAAELARLGCDVVQGFLYSGPRPADRVFDTWLFAQALIAVPAGSHPSRPQSPSQAGASSRR